MNLTIVKVGGKVVEEDNSLSALLDDFASLTGAKALVHGGGRSATKLSEQLGIQAQMIEGRRVTDAQTLRIVTMVYAGLSTRISLPSSKPEVSTPSASRVPIWASSAPTDAHLR